MREHDPDAALTDAQRQAAERGHKAMMPIHGRPFLDYVLSALADAGLTRTALVVAPDHGALRDYYAREAPPSRLRVDFVVQPDARGTADAMLAVESWTAREPFLTLNADNLYPVDALRDLAALDEPGLPAFDADDLVRSSNIPTARLAAFALLDIGEDGYLRSIVEKPAAPSRPSSPSRPSYVSMNVWRFDARIFGACRDVPQSVRGEYELPEAVGLALTRGMRFRAVRARGPVLDLSRRADAADVERRVAGVEVRP
jgi:glucose-1-phosphate thymidylyltransferase